jgi:hypothetical protein
MESHSFVFASLDGQTIGFFAIRFWREFPGRIDAHEGSK